MPKRKTINISVHDELYEYIRERADGGYFGSVSEYFRWLVRCDREDRIENDVKKNARDRVRTANEAMIRGKV
jgi:Arc/MetJ-type ribon-helix-helix transcriptional regulator